MLKALRLILPDFDKEHLQNNYFPNDSQKTAVKGMLEKYIGTDSSIDGTKLSEDWFPEINSDVFISHSHLDEDVALSLKAKIEKETQHKCFVDSSVWGNSKVLLKYIDDIFTLANSNFYKYDYGKRNYSTSHVYLMLNVALQKMIFKSQFVIFLDTPESISVEDTINFSTNSPWIYSEISTVCQICEMQRVLIKSSLSEERHFSNLNIKYKLDFSDFKEIRSADELIRLLSE